MAWAFQWPSDFVLDAKADTVVLVLLGVVFVVGGLGELLAGLALTVLSVRDLLERRQGTTAPAL